MRLRFESRSSQLAFFRLSDFRVHSFSSWEKMSKSSNVGSTFCRVLTQHLPRYVQKNKNLLLRYIQEIKNLFLRSLQEIHTVISNTRMTEGFYKHDLK